uniref:tRNA (uracil-O(2)-)-methyltransferase n=2 Tax=Arion vulgaris TaxID=1028688 RepID=A0A0B7B3H1_9EUPU
MAARSSYKTSFFLLPCCPHDFDSKFSRHEKGKSKYETYMNYVKKITVECGFKPESDTLRIPSTKRICIIGRRRSYEKVDELMVEERRQAFIDKGTVYKQSISNKDISKPCVQALKQTTDVDSHPPLPTDFIEVGLQTSTIASVVQNMMTPRHNKLAENSNDVCMHEEEDSLVSSSATSSLDSNYSLTCGEKRTIESLESTDSGFYEQETTHSVDNSGTKRRKNSTGTVSSGESQSSDPENTSPVDANSKFTFSQNLNGRNVGSSQVVKATQWATGFQLRAEQTVRNCQKVPEQIKFKIVETVFNHILAAPDSRTVLLSNGKTWTMGGSVALNKVAALFDKPTMQELKSECGGLQTLLRNHSHVFQVTGGFVQLRDFTVSDPWIGRKVKKVKNNRDLQDTRKTTLCWFDTHHPCGCPRTKENCQFAHGQDELRNKLSRVKLQ